jgi:hypothetical protein
MPRGSSSLFIAKVGQSLYVRRPRAIFQAGGEKAERTGGNRTSQLRPASEAVGEYKGGSQTVTVEEAWTARKSLCCLLQRAGDVVQQNLPGRRMTALALRLAMPTQVKAQESVAGLGQRGTDVRIAPAVLSKAVGKTDNGTGLAFWLPALGKDLQVIAGLPTEFKVFQVVPPLVLDRPGSRLHDTTN